MYDTICYYISKYCESILYKWGDSSLADDDLKVNKIYTFYYNL